MNPADKYRNALATLPPPGAGNEYHRVALMRVANYAAAAGFAEDQATAEIMQATPTGGRPVTDSEVRSAVRKALADRGKPYRPPPKPRPPEADWDALRDALMRRGSGASEADLWELSPARLDWCPGPQDAVALLASLYRPDDVVCIGTDRAWQARPVNFWLDAIRDGYSAPHIVPNPVTGLAAPKKSGDGLSTRADAAVAAYRFVICESDTLPRQDQLALLYGILADRVLRVACIIDTGGKSMHAWLRADYPDAASWEANVTRGLYADAGPLTALGFDPASKTPAHLSRLAGHYREEKKRRQRLLYLNPAEGEAA